MMVDSCSLQNEITLEYEGIDKSLFDIISKFEEGSEVHLFCKTDFSKNLVELINNNFSHLPLKAKLLRDDESGMLIKVKYPKDGEGCCGCCS